MKVYNETIADSRDLSVSTRAARIYLICITIEHRNKSAFVSSVSRGRGKMYRALDNPYCAILIYGSPWFGIILACLRRESDTE